MLMFVDVRCPYCGESIELPVDPSGGAQSYVEDCQVCCRPMGVHVVFDADGEPGVVVMSDSDG